MKIRYIIVIALCVLLAAVWFSWDRGLLIQKQEAAFLVPQEAVVFVEQQEIGALLDDFQKSRLGRSLATIDFLRIGRDLSLPEKDLANLEQALDTIKDLADNKLFREFCGKSMSLALLPVDPSAKAGKTAAGSSLQALLIAKPLHKAELYELISSIYTGDVKQTELHYDRFTIKRFQIGDEMIFVAIVDGFFLLTVEEQTLHLALDASRQSDTSLARNVNYQKLRNQYQKPKFFAFCSLEGVRRQFAEMVKQGPLDLQKEFADQLASTVGLQYTSYGVWQDKELLKDTSITLVDQTIMEPFVRQMLSLPPEHNDTLRLVPENILTYYWSNTFALHSLWKMYEEKNKNDTAEIDRFKAAFKKTTGRDIAEVLPLINGGVSLFLQKGDPKAFIPLPHFAVFIKLKDRKEGEDILQKIVEDYGIPLQTITYKKVSYSSYGLSLQGGLQALYGFHDDFLFLANSSDVLEEIIDTLESGRGLQAGETYARMNLDMKEGNNSVCFIRISDLISDIKNIIGWTGTILAVKDREAAAKSKIVIEELINPLLDGMTMFSTISTRSRLAKEQIVVESTMLLNPPQKPLNN